MQITPLNPDVNDLAPSGPALTAYDAEHAITYVRMLDANQEGADWREVARIVLHIDPEEEPDRARRAFDSHLASQMGRARWLSAAPRWRPSLLVTRAEPTNSRGDH
jgi:hypothetical protein